MVTLQKQMWSSLMPPGFGAGTASVAQNRSLIFVLLDAVQAVLGISRETERWGDIAVC